MNYDRGRRLDADYTVYGPRIEIGDVKVTLDQVEPLRRYVVQDFFRALGKFSTRFSEVQDVTLGGKQMTGYGSYDPDMPDTFVGARVRHDLDDTWRMIIMKSSFCDTRRDDKKIVRHFFEVIAGNVIIAKKEARIKQGRQNIEIDEIGITETVTSSRKMFEKAVDAAECERLQQSLRQTVNYLDTLNK